MTTRAASATVSLRAKQNLVRLLFADRYSRKGPDAHRLLDHSIYTYSDLRREYLKRIHILHPDKKHHVASNTTNNGNNNKKNGNHNSHQSRTNGYHQNSETNNNVDTKKFMELQEAWNRYEELAKMMKRVGLHHNSNKENSNENNNNAVDANFTMFGVGCSFSDNEIERDMRSKIMDQASKGWFSAGEIMEHSSHKNGNNNNNNMSSTTTTSLLDDDMFNEDVENITKRYNSFDNKKDIQNNGNVTTHKDQTTTIEKANMSRHRRPSLISHLIPPVRK